MPRTVVEWEWEAAFDKFGFGDGDSWNGTNIVASAIDALGYTVECDGWGCHNYLIMDIEKDGKSILFDDNQKWNAEVLKRIQARGGGEGFSEHIGYADPNLYLPDDILAMLYATFTDDYEVAA
jgi:hypothetical protein